MLIDGSTFDDSMNLPHSRKLKVADDAPRQPINTSLIQTTATISSTLQFEEPTASMKPPPAPPPNSQLQQNYPGQLFDSCMALTVLGLLAALFLMGFFSIFTRRFSTDPTADPELSSYRQRRRHPGPSRTTTSAGESRVLTASSSCEGLDPEIVKSLPVYTYSHVDRKYQMECAICLGEYEAKESVRIIPKCNHVFHLDCIDTWLKVHGSCPVCRGTRFFEINDKNNGGELGFDVKDGRVDQGVSEEDGRPTRMENYETLIGVREMRH